MIVTVLESEGESIKLLQQADLTLQKTDMETVDGERLYEVVKNRYGRDGKYVSENKIQGFVQDYELKDERRKELPEEPPGKELPF